MILAVIDHHSVDKDKRFCNIVLAQYCYNVTSMDNMYIVIPWEETKIDNLSYPIWLFH